MTEFDKIVKQKLSEATYPTDEAMWNDIESSLNQAAGSGTGVQAAFYSGIAASALMIATFSGLSDYAVEQQQAAAMASVEPIEETYDLKRVLDCEMPEYIKALEKQEAHAIEFVSTVKEVVAKNETKASEPKSIQSPAMTAEGAEPMSTKEINTASVEADFAANGIQCPSGEIAFSANVKGASASISWIFDGVDVKDGSNVTHQFESKGEHEVTMIAKTADGSSYTVKKSIEIFAGPSPSVDYKISESSSCFDQEVTLMAEPVANSYYWYVNGRNAKGATARIALEQGTYDLQLTAVNEEGCESTSSQLLVISGGLQLFIPNAFTPNSDGTNDTWFPTGLENCSSFSIEVFNVGGQKVFSTTDIEHWDGRINGGQFAAYGDIFTYSIVATDECGKTIQKRGQINAR